MKVYSEEESIRRMYNLAARQGCLMEVKQTYEKYAKLVRLCKNDQERDQIATLGIIELHKLLNIKGGLTIDHKEVLPPDNNIDKIIEKHNEI